MRYVMKKIVPIIMLIVFSLIVSSIAVAGGRHHNNRGYNNHYPEAFLGGVIVGGVIGSTFRNPYYYRRPVYVNAYPVPIASGSNFLLKSNGDCFLMTNNSNGDQILSSVPVSNCR